MTEFLPKINFYFDPKDVNSIYNSILNAFETNENELMKNINYQSGPIKKV